MRGSRSTTRSRVSAKKHPPALAGSGGRIDASDGQRLADRQTRLIGRSVRIGTNRQDEGIAVTPDVLVVAITAAVHFVEHGAEPLVEGVEQCGLVVMSEDAPPRVGLVRACTGGRTLAENAVRVKGRCRHQHSRA